MNHDLPSNVKIHTVLQVEHIAQNYVQIPEISLTVSARKHPVPEEIGNTVAKIDKIMYHRKRGKNSMDHLSEGLSSALGEVETDHRLN